jgi:hypothetical protein
MAELSPVKAAINLVAEFNNIDGKTPWHSVYIQHRTHEDGREEDVLMVHILPGHESKYRTREKHFGYHVEVHPWPVSPHAAA